MSFQASDYAWLLGTEELRVGDGFKDIVARHAYEMWDTPRRKGRTAQELIHDLEMGLILEAALSIKGQAAGHPKYAWDHHMKIPWDVKDYETGVTFDCKNQTSNYFNVSTENIQHLRDNIDHIDFVVTGHAEKKGHDAVTREDIYDVTFKAIIETSTLREHSPYLEKGRFGNYYYKSRLAVSKGMAAVLNEDLLVGSLKNS